MAELTLTITEVPSLPADPGARAAAIQALAEDFGSATVAQGFSRPEHMPSQASYSAASAVAMMLLSEGSCSLAMLVNLIAAIHDHAGLTS